jgi:hypothetical protein
MRTLEKHPDARYQSAYDLADDLEAFMRDARMHSGPVRIARYLDALTHAAGGARRPELVSEAEARGESTGDLDFDSQVFDAYAPTAQKDWEDAEQPEADIAAALGMELAELRALRTPVPMRPAGMAEITGKPPRAAGTEGDGDADATTPVALVDPEPEPVPGPAAARPAKAPGGGAAADADGDADDKVPTLARRGGLEALIGAAAAAAPAAAAPAAPAAPAAEAPAPAAPAIPAAALPPRPVLDLAAMPPPTQPSPGGSLVATAPFPRSSAAEGGRSLAQRLPWILVGALGVAVAALVAYIVMRA